MPYKWNIYTTYHKRTKNMRNLHTPYMYSHNDSFQNVEQNEAWITLWNSHSIMPAARQQQIWDKLVPGQNDRNIVDDIVKYVL